MKKKIYMCGIIIFSVVSVGILGYHLYNRNQTKVLQSNDDQTKSVGVMANVSTPDQKDMNNEGAQKSKTIQDKPLSPKEVFLTFDDGPSVNTSKILKILDDNNVKATFFLVGQNVDKHPDLVKAEYNDGMSIGNHSYTHEYSMYKSVEATIADFNKCNESIKNTIGIEPFQYIRFPGGSDNAVPNHNTMKDIRNSFVANGMQYIDWNVDSGDADKVKVPADVIKNNILKELTKTNFAVILMHDAPIKTTTVDALPEVIDYLKKQGYVFRTLDDLTPTEREKMIKMGILNRNVNKQ